MRTRRSWRNQNRLWKELAGKPVYMPRPKEQCDPAIQAEFAKAADEEFKKLRAKGKL